MSQVSFDDLPDDARVWCFAVEPEPGPRETAHLLASMQRFVDQWTAHRQDLTAGLSLLCERFLVVGLDEHGAGASGCSIDALMGHLALLERELGIRLADAAPVWYRDSDGRIQSVDRAEFRKLAKSGRVGPETPVFDLTASTLGSIRAGEFERPASTSWHAQLL
jgi:hypothetical protein